MSATSPRGGLDRLALAIWLLVAIAVLAGIWLGASLYAAWSVASPIPG